MLRAFILSLLVLTPKHELNKNSVLLSELCAYCEMYSQQYNIPATLIAFQAYKESSLNPHAKGKYPNKWGVILKEQGYAQVHGKAKKACIKAGHIPLTRKGGIGCIAYLLDMGKQICGTLEKGLIWYASGSCKGTERTQIKMKNRLRTWRKKVKELQENDQIKKQ